MIELEILKSRYGISREETTIRTPETDVLFIVKNEKELFCPEIPMLINTIENSYCNIVVYGKSPYVEKFIIT